MIIAQEPQRQAPITTAVVTFFGPDATSQIKAINSAGAEVAHFSLDSTGKSDFSILRHVSPTTAPVPICTGHKSSLAGTTTMSVHGQQVKLATTSGGLAIVYDTLEIPMLGSLKWKTLNGKQYDLVGPGSATVAHAELGEMKFSVFVPGDEVTLDCLLAGWVAFTQNKKGSEVDSKHLGTALKIIGHLAGGVGGGGG